MNPGSPAHDSLDAPEPQAPLGPRRSDPGKLFLLLPLLTLTLGLVWMRASRQEEQQQLAAPPPRDQERPVAGWSGQADLEDGTLLVASLAPLHAGAREQAFDAATLAARYDLAPGQPWRLDLRRSRAAGGELTEQEPLALGALELGAGSAGLTTLPAPRPSEGMPVDPVAILLAPPVEPLPAGREISVVLWGQAPGSDESLELQLGQRRIELAPGEVQRSEVVRPLVLGGVDPSHDGDPLQGGGPAEGE